MDTRRLIGKRIQALRRSRGYSQEKLAEIVGINAKYLSSVERGVENPTLDLFIRLSKGLNVGIHEIFSIEHEGQSPKALRRKLKTLIDEIGENHLRQAMRILEVLTHEGIRP